MKVLIVNSFYYPNLIGGAEHSVKNLAETLVKNNHEVHVLCIGSEDCKEIINGVKVHRIKNININSAIEYQNKENTSIVSKLIYRGIDLHGCMNRNKVKEIIKEISPDIAHVNNFPGFGLDLFKVLKQLKVPTIFTARDYYSLCPNARLMDKQGEICSNRKKICEIYGKANKRGLNKINHITAPSNFTLKLIKDNFNIKSENMSCIYNSIDIDFDQITNLYIQKKENLENKQYIDIVFLGCLDRYKGIDRLVEYCINTSRLGVRLHIAGNGPLKEMINDYQKKYDNIKYYGKLKENELNRLLQKCDILAAPSMWYEPFGRIVLDAYKNCMPVISTGNGGLGELIKENKTGFIISFKDEQEFIEIINKYKDKELLIRHMENCKNEIVKYSNKVIVEEYESLYKKVIANNYMGK